MATLQSILKARSPESPETNLEQGKMWAFSVVTDYVTYSGCHCWIAPAAGTVDLEVIGAGGSGSRMCCCSTDVGIFIIGQVLLIFKLVARLCIQIIGIILLCIKILVVL